MAFTYDPSTNRGRVRLLLSDTDTVTEANQIFSDAEIDAFLSLENNSVYAAAAAGCRSIAASTSRSAIAWKALNESIDREAVPRHFRLLAGEYEDKADSVPAEEIYSSDYNVNRYGDQTGEAVGDELL